MSTPFHYAFQVKSLGVTKMFFCEILNCKTIHIAEDHIEFDFYGHHITAHLSPDMEPEDKTTVYYGTIVPMPHFGAVLPKEEWQQLAEKLENAGMEFILKPQTLNSGKSNEQSVMIIADPSGNALEFIYYPE
jgi:extradiol dioxygenase family protein